jgi:hypothetical protein
MQPKPPGPPVPLAAPGARPNAAVQRRLAAPPRLPGPPGLVHSAPAAIAQGKMRGFPAAGAIHPRAASAGHRSAGAPRVPVLQRMESPNRKVERGLITDQPIPALGTYVVQNEEKYIGTGTAHTSNLATCCALAMHSRTTGLSFLFHVDDSTNPHGLAGRIDCYVREVNQALGWVLDLKTLKAFYCNEVDIWILSPEGNRNGSVSVARTALTIVAGAELLCKVKLIEEDIERDTRIVVGPNGVQIILTRAQKIARAFRNVRRKKTYANADALYFEINAASQYEWVDFLESGFSAYDLLEIAKLTQHAQLRGALEEKEPRLGKF